MDTFTFKGKPEVRNHHLVVPYHELLPIRANSMLARGEKPNLHTNAIIHGDNLLALKALRPSHAGAVDIVYIDPPYNTGNATWDYNDNVNNPLLQEWLGKTVDRDDLVRHDKWCCMMWPRLRLLHDLLAETGAIFVSIDDNEHHRLRMLLDEIFGPQNFVSTIIWERKYSPANDAKYFSATHDYIVCYAKNKTESGWKRRLLPRSDAANGAYNHDDNDGRGPWKSGDLSVKTYSKNLEYPVTNPMTGKAHNPPAGRVWLFNKSKMNDLIRDNRIDWGKSGKSGPALKRYLSEVKEGVVPKTVWRYDDGVGHTDAARKLIKKIFNDVERPFDNPKSVPLIERIIQIGGDDDALVLDSFAGSGTTAHAVMSLNEKDGGSRRFILVESEDYADTTTAERVRRVIKGYNDTPGIKSSFTYFELGGTVSQRSLLEGALPKWHTLARYIFFNATGEHMSEKEADPSTYFVGRSKRLEVYLYYKPSRQYLKSESFTSDMANALPKVRGRRTRLVFAPNSHVEDEYLAEKRIEFCRIPFTHYVPDVRGDDHAT